jgi:hypothetical protein
MRSVKVVLAVGLALTVIVAVAVLSRAPLTVAGTNSVPARSEVELEHGDVGSCQPAGALPSGTSAVRLGLEGRAVGPLVRVRVLSGSRILTEGRRVAGWGSAPTVTVPVKALTRALTGARVCVTVGPMVEPLRVHGMPVRPRPAGASKLQAMAIRMEYLRPGPKSWWSLASAVADHMGMGRAPSGSWVGYLVLALMVAVAVLASGLALRDLR